MHAYDATLTAGEVQSIRDLGLESDDHVRVLSETPVPDSLYFEVRLETTSIWMSDQVTQLVERMRAERAKAISAHRKTFQA